MTVVQLGHPLNSSTPRSLVAEPFQHRLTQPHTPFDGPDVPTGPSTITSATDWIAIGCHVGTHVDSLSHIGRGGLLHGGATVDVDQSDERGVTLRDVPELRPVVTRAVLLDFATMQGRDRIDADTELTGQDLRDCAEWASVSINPGDGVLIRTGWDTLVAEGGTFTSLPLPGPELDAARYLTGLGVCIVGSDTMPFEAAPGVTPLAVHAELILDHGIQIMEMLDLRELADRRAWSFTLVVAPLRIEGGTGSPVNPLAILD